jgi:hypothetical protein
MVQVSEGEPGNPAISANKIKQTEAGVEIQFKLLSAPFHPAPLNDFLMPDRQVRLQLDAMVNDYMEYIKGLTQSDGLKNYVSVLATANYFPSGAPDRPTSMMSGLHSLEFLKTCIFTVEGSVINSIVSR